MDGNIEEPNSSQETASLVKRLAGPSTGKAGLAKDQTEINRTIAEASKGSKFYENEKKKDKDLTERIRKILKQRDDVIRGADIKSIEQSVDRILAELEAQRDLTQTIVHIDMDAFFANVELLHNPDLEGKPFGVGYGVLTTASYEARKYGVRSGMPGFIAKKLCPQLILVSNHFSRYVDMSEAVMSVLRRYDPNMCTTGCDEGYLNITPYCQQHDLTPEECVQEMRQVVLKETKLTASAGIAPNKMLAKICSDRNKPNGQFQLPFDTQSILAFLRDLSIRKIQGIGRVNERLLESIGIKTCGDIYTHRAIIYLMDKQFGSLYLFRTYLGISSNVVKPLERSERKSIGAERTFSPINDTNKILQKLNEVSIELEKDMQQNKWTGRTITLKYKLDTYQVFTRSKSFDRWVTKEDLYSTGKELLLPEFPLSIRLIGLRLTKLKDLKAPPEPPNGIKRFFEPLQLDSSRKRPKAEYHEIDSGSSYQSDFQLHDDLDEAMPGFHELNEEDNDIHQAYTDEYIVPETLQDVPPKSRPPLSAPAQSIRIPGITNSEMKQYLASRPASDLVQPVHRSTKPHSIGSTVPSSKPEKESTSQFDCPVCGKTLQTDNQGLNSHIDFCLSRGAIRQAHAEASSPTKKSVPISWKPISKGKNKK